jgi:hypothetical protein
MTTAFGYHGLAHSPLYEDNRIMIVLRSFYKCIKAVEKHREFW